MTTIRLRSPKELGPALRKLGRDMDKAAVIALRKTARWGATEAVRVSATTAPRPRARGTFERSFVVTKLPDGAILSNGAQHARFAEVGRRAGRMPPIAAIIEWMIAKKMARGGTPEALDRARNIARKIGRRGTKGAYVMRRTVPGLRKRLPIELALAMRAAFERAGR